ncbi:MAG: hypothetical protein M0D57_03310 [Sphingobacteriales bacterium JAD_PAG50586_3]|nr:MAG: hypothetical protein M0D57_03310 [Sphingobacteriales bacterium JAD_PAG50586_3]
MNYLATLSPAQNLILLGRGSADYKLLLKSTLLDLMLKQVLESNTVIKQASKHDPEVEYTYITVGPAFNNHIYDDYEKAFLSPFLKDGNFKVLFSKLVKIAYQNTTTSNLHNQVARSTDFKVFVKQNLWQKLVGGYSFTVEGFRAMDDVRAEVEKLEGDIANETDKNKRIQLLKPIYGNILLLQGLPDGMFAEFDEVIAKEFNTKNDSGCSGCGTWVGVDNYSDGFDSGCSGHSSGCGGDSGCSGCSGCGGCGGCGGGD